LYTGALTSKYAEPRFNQHNSIPAMKYKMIATALLLIAGKVAVYGQYSATWKQLGEYARADSMLVQKGPDALMLSKAYGYIVGKEIMAERISGEYPEIAPLAQGNLLKLMTSWGMSASRIKFALERLTKLPYQYFDSLIVEQAVPLLYAQPLSFTTALEFVQTLEEQSAGNYIESPYLETLLTYRFPSAPLEEMDAGFTQEYISGDNPAALGLPFGFSLPLSWQQKENPSPNVVDMFVSEQGEGLEGVTVSVVSTGTGEAITSEDMDEQFTEKNMPAVLPAGSVLHSIKKIGLAGKTGYQVVFQKNEQMLDLSLYGKYIMYITYGEDKLLFLSGSVFHESETTAAKRYERFLPFFRQVAASLYFY
jgi:hypothetical protein